MTSREELQSLRKELNTINSQLQSKIKELEETNNDLNNLLTSTGVPMVFLNRQLLIKRFTPAMLKLLEFSPSDVGRSIKDMSQEGFGLDLIDDARAVLDHLTPVKKEIKINSSWHMRVILPYRTADNRIKGVVITYNDISELKKAEERTKHLASFPQVNPNPVIEVDSSGRITFFNSGSQKLLEDLGVNKENIDLFLPKDLGDILQQLKKKKEAAFYREVSIKDRTFGANVHLVPQFDVVRLYTFDITERKRAENVMQTRLRMLASAYTGSISVDKVLQMTLDEIEAQTGSSIGFYHYLEADQETLSLQNWSTNTIQTMCTAEGKGQHYNISRAGVWVDCVRERRPVIHNEYASLPHRRGMPAGHAPVVREMIIPIMRGDRIVAIIGLGNKSTDYNATDVEIASLLGDFSWEIIERKQAEEALRQSEEQLRRAQEIAHLGSWELDLEHNVLTWSDEVYRIFGFKPQEFGASYEAFLDAVHPDDRKAVDEAYSSSVSEGRNNYEIEHRIVRRSTGEVRVVHEKCEHFRDEAGRIVRSAGMVHDITERKGYEEALLKSKQEWERTFDSVPDLIAILDPQYRILRANRAMAERLGTTPEQCLGLNCFTRVHGTAGPPACCPHTLTMQDGKQHVAEVYEERFDGYFLVTTTPLFDDEGNILGTVHVARDITERKQAEEEVKKLNKDLNNSVIQLEAANRELEAFSSSVSHDLRAPLRTISGFSQALLEDYADKLDAEGRDSLERIVAGTHRMGQLIDDLLNLSRITRTEMKRKRMNLSEMAANIAARLKKNEPDRQVDWIIAADVFAEGDGQLLLLVLDNLLRNAFKFTAKKQDAGIEFGVTVQDGERIYFVKDNGAGFDMSYGGKLFQPFQRLHTIHDFPGTGIGLATVKRIINRHGGRTWIEGEPEKGAVVYFTLGEQTGEQSA